MGTKYTGTESLAEGLLDSYQSHYHIGLLTNWFIIARCSAEASLSSGDENYTVHLRGSSLHIAYMASNSYTTHHSFIDNLYEILTTN